MQRLYGLGARKVAFNGLPPLGCIPSQRVKSATGECIAQVNSYAVQFNAAAKKLLDGMNAKLPGAQMALADCYSVVKELIDHPERNGMVTSTAPANPFRCVVVRRRPRRAATVAGGSAGWRPADPRRATARTGPSTCSGTRTTPPTPPTGSSPTASGPA